MEKQKQINQDPEEESQIQQEYNPVPEEKMAQKKNNKGIVIGLVILVLLLLGGGTYWWLQKDIISTIYNPSKDEGIIIQEGISQTEDQYEIKKETCLEEISVDELYGMSNLHSIYKVDKNGEHYEEIEKTFHDKRGSVVDSFGETIKEHIELYLDPIPCTGLSEDAGRLTFVTDDNGEFNFVVDELGAYILSLEDGWYSEVVNALSPVDFRNGNGSYRIVVYNEKHKKEVKDKYTRTVKQGDTLWSIAVEYYGEGYYWPLLARDNSLEESEGIPNIYAGDELIVSSRDSFDIDYLEQLRVSFYADEFQDTIKIINNDFGYSIEYPGNWIAGIPENQEYDINARYYKSHVHKQGIMGPDYRQSYSIDNKWLPAFVDIYIHDNTAGMDVYDFIAYKNNILIA